MKNYESQDAFTELFSHYKGITEEKPGEIRITNRNTITDYWGNPKKVDCVVEVHISFIVDPNRYSVQAEEKTLEILGGCSCGCLSKEEALSRAKIELERFCFKKKEIEEIPLL